LVSLFQLLDFSGSARSGCTSRGSSQGVLNGCLAGGGLANSPVKC